MRISLPILLFMFCGMAQAQPVLKAGDLFPDMVIRPIINAPVKALDIHANDNRKFLILNFWGTWCGPCLPEMDSLARLQVRNDRHVQVIGISNDPVSKLQQYLQRKPSSLWLASDTTSNLYQQFGFNSVGQAAIIDQQHRILALVNTDSINQALIDKLLRKEPIPSSAETGNRRDYEAEAFTADSSTGFQVTWSGYRPGLTSMSKFYPKGPFKGRRFSIVNLSLCNMYQRAYDISPYQLINEIPEKGVCNWEDKNSRYCFDLIVKPEQKDSLFIIMRQLLHQLSPVKARLEKREMPVYVLRKLPATNWKESAVTESSYSSSGNGFDGKGIPMKPFADYIADGLGLPVVDETGLTGKYDIVTKNVLPTADYVLASLKEIGLSVEKTTRVMDAVVVYR